MLELNYLGDKIVMRNIEEQSSPASELSTKFESEENGRMRLQASPVRKIDGFFRKALEEKKVLGLKR